MIDTPTVAPRYRAWTSRFHIATVLLVSVLVETAIVLGSVTGLFFTPFTDCNCYGFPLPWRYGIVTPGGYGPGTIYSWPTLVLDVVFFVSAGCVIVVSSMAYKRKLRGLAMKRPAMILAGSAIAYMTIMLELYLWYAGVFYGSGTLPVL